MSIKASELVLAPNGSLYHINLTGDTLADNVLLVGDPDRVKADRPEHFFSSQLATLGEVCRPADSAIAARAAQVAWDAYRRRALFDHNYDDADTTRFYCTELVAFAYRQAGVDLAEGRGHHINLPTMQQDCLFPSDIYESKFLYSIVQF